MEFQDDVRFRHLKTEDDVSNAWEFYKLRKFQTCLSLALSPHAIATYTKTAGSGFVHFPTPQVAALGLEPNKNVVPGFENVYLISAFHGLHCLQKLHIAFARLRSNSTRDADDHDINHAAHCFSYLRQSILCAGDMTLEGPDRRPERGESPLRGWGVEHQCRAWEEVVKWRDQHAIPDIHKRLL